MSTCVLHSKHPIQEHVVIHVVVDSFSLLNRYFLPYLAAFHWQLHSTTMGLPSCKCNDFWWRKSLVDCLRMSNYNREYCVITMLEMLGWQSLSQHRFVDQQTILWKATNDIVEKDKWYCGKRFTKKLLYQFHHMLYGTQASLEVPTQKALSTSVHVQIAIGTAFSPAPYVVGIYYWPTW